MRQPLLMNPKTLGCLNDPLPIPANRQRGHPSLNPTLRLLGQDGKLLAEWLNTAVRRDRYITADGQTKPSCCGIEGMAFLQSGSPSAIASFHQGRRLDVPCRSSCTASTGPRYRVRGTAPTTGRGHRHRNAANRSDLLLNRFSLVFWSFSWWRHQRVEGSGWGCPNRVDSCGLHQFCVPFLQVIRKRLCEKYRTPRCCSASTEACCSSESWRSESATCFSRVQFPGRCISRLARKR